jgi:NAD(P)-dependent dehydrogenase (short-subunit alcohol dehydrogenase family)
MRLNSAQSAAVHHSQRLFPWCCGARLLDLRRVADVLEQECRTLARELGDRAIFSRLDVTSDDDWDAAVTAAEAAFGPVSVLINNAGIVCLGVIEETDPATWR